MKKESSPCVICMPSGQAEIFNDRDEALVKFKKLLRKGQMPYMCQQDDGAYKVCATTGDEKFGNTP